jgi:hypothetical protein
MQTCRSTNNNSSNHHEAQLNKDFRNRKIQLGILVETPTGEKLAHRNGLQA